MPDSRLRQQIGNAVLFNLSWLLIVAGESNLLAPVVAAAHVALHMAWMGQGRREALYIAGFTAFGIMFDQLLFALGMFTGGGDRDLAPLWLSCLWPVLATTPGHAFAALQQRPRLAAVLGAGGGMLSYSAGVGMTAVEYWHPLWGVVLIGALWALLFPAMTVLSRLILEEVPRAAHPA